MRAPSIPLRVAASFVELERDPIGRALIGRSFVAWCATPRLVGTVHLRRRDLADAQALIRLYSLGSHRALRPPLRRVVDGRAFDGVDEDAWNEMVATLAPRVEALRQLFERQAVIVAHSIAGARMAALLPALGPTDTFRVFTDATEAYRWADPAAGPSAHAQVETLCQELEGASLLAGRARSWIRANLRAAKIHGCARALGVGSRSLQRGLAAEGTTFRDVVMEERVAAAREALRGEAKVDAVARAVGCGSASQLAALLRRAGLPSPAKLRQDLRAAR